MRIDWWVIWNVDGLGVLFWSILECRPSLSLSTSCLQARHHCQRVRGVMLLYIKCQVGLSLLQLINCLCLLPPALSPQLVLWLSVFIVPLLSFTLMGNPFNRIIAQMAQGKNTARIVKQVNVAFRWSARSFVWCSYVISRAWRKTANMHCCTYIEHGVGLRVGEGANVVIRLVGRVIRSK